MAGASPTRSAPNIASPHFTFARSLSSRSSRNARIALGLDHEVEAVASVLLDEHRPVGVAAAERCGHGEPAGQLRIDLDRAVLLELVSEGLLRVGVVHHLLVNGLLHDHQVLEIAGYFLTLVGKPPRLKAIPRSSVGLVAQSMTSLSADGRIMRVRAVRAR